MASISSPSSPSSPKGPWPTKVHFVGSIPLADVSAVMTKLGSGLGNHLDHMPDGEPGFRASFSAWYKAAFLHVPFLMHPSDLQGEKLPRDAMTSPPADSGAPVPLGPTHYDDITLESYNIFRSLRAKGIIPSGVRFQVCLPSPISLITRWVGDRDFLLAAEAAYEKRQAEALAVIQNHVPTEELAVQWDVPVEFIMLEGVAGPRDSMKPWFGGGSAAGEKERADLREAIIARWARLAGYVRPDVQLGFHFCYGDIGHKHVVEPRDAGEMAALATGILSRAGRKIDWIHMPVPKDRVDEAYLLPLSAVSSTLHGSGTSLFLGLVHPWDLDGTKQRIEIARAVLKCEFGIATECGLGRTDEKELEAVIDVCKAIVGQA